MSNDNFPWTELRVQAVLDTLEQDDSYWYRYFCREYSRSFFTPLAEVFKLPFSLVYQNVLENNFSNVPDDKRVEVFNKLLDFEETPEEKKQLDDQIKQWEKEYEKEKKDRKDKGFTFESMAGAHKFKKKKPVEKPVDKTYSIEEDEED